MDVNGSQEIKSFNAQPPDVLSGLDNISQNIEDEQNDENSSSKSSSEFESIYDKYKDKSDEEVNEVESDEAPAVAYQPAEVSNDELNEMLEDLEVEANGNSCAIESAPVEQLGARPKEFSVASNEVPDLVMNTDVQDTQEYAENNFPKESPPPYSEVDPLKKSKERPNSLDLPSEPSAPIQSEAIENPPESENAGEQNNEETEETTNEGIAAADVFKLVFLLLHFKFNCVLTLKANIFTPQISERLTKTPLLSPTESLCQWPFSTFLLGCTLQSTLYIFKTRKIFQSGVEKYLLESKGPIPKRKPVKSKYQRVYLKKSNRFSFTRKKLYNVHFLSDTSLTSRKNRANFLAF